MGLAEIALIMLCIHQLCVSLSMMHLKDICLFIFTLISWVCYCLAFFLLGVSLSQQPSTDYGSASLACSALLFVGLANSIVCRSVPDRHRNLCASYQQLAQIVFVLVLILSRWSTGPRAPFGWLLATLFVLWLAQQRSRLLSASARSRTKDDLLISEYMAKSHSQDQEPSPGGLRSSCNYIVAGEVANTTSCVVLLRVLLKHLTDFSREAAPHRRAQAFFHDLRHAFTPGATAYPVIRYDTLVTVQDIWKHIKPSPSCPTSFFPFPGQNFLDVRDLCLSFALFKLVRRRFRGCNLHESGLGKTREFALQYLLCDSPRNAYYSLSHPMKPPSSLQKTSRSFRIIQAELGFLFDFFYGNHLPGFVSSILFIACTASLASVFYHQLRDNHTTQGIKAIETAASIFVMFPALGIGHLCQALNNGWKVNQLVHACRRRKRLSLSQLSTTFGDYFHMDLGLGLLMLFSFPTSRSGYWLHNCTARQYCLLLGGDYHRATTSKIHIRAWEALVDALVDALRHRDGVLSAGQSSLSRNGVYTQLSWACRQEYVAQKIIVWHVATTLCNVGYVAKSTLNGWQRSFPQIQTGKNQGKQTDENHEVATVLSGYCAYLVGFSPELIADDIYATRLVFHNATTEASERLKGEGSLERMSDSAKKMTFGFGNGGIDSAAAAKLEVVSQGKILAAQLIKHEDDVRWRVMAEFWAELMLFISPADNAAAHLEKLKTGGEFITYIWTLLTHAGILTRPSEEKDQTFHLRDREDHMEISPV